MSTNNELMQRRSNAVPRGVGQIHPILPSVQKTVGSGTLKAVNSLTLLAVLQC